MAARSSVFGQVVEGRLAGPWNGVLVPMHAHKTSGVHGYGCSIPSLLMLITEGKTPVPGVEHEAQKIPLFRICQTDATYGHDRLLAIGVPERGVFSGVVVGYSFLVGALL